jgi:hypothetical protein
MHLQVYGGEEKRENTRSRSLASPRRVGQGGVGRWARAHDVHVNSPPKSGPRPPLLFIFATSPGLIRFDRDRPSRLWDVVTLGGPSLYICAAATEIVRYQQPRKHQHI